MKKIKRNFFPKILAAAISIYSISAGASCIYNSFSEWKDCFVKDKLSTISNSVDIEVFQDAKFVERAVELDRGQPEKKLTFEKYLKLIDLNGKIKRGVEFYAANMELLNEIERQYNVEATSIVAMVGLESDYGKKQGRFNIVDTLATLAYEGRRRNFFENELIKVLQIARNENLVYTDLTGSWAGAMGQIQFMPSSYLSYAVDYDGDGKADIWNSSPDVFASAANYLASNGWKKDASYIREVRSVPEKCEIKQKRCKVGRSIFVFHDSDQHNLAFEVGENFESLMKWNRSIYFCTAALMISDAIKAHTSSKKEVNDGY